MINNLHKTGILLIVVSLVVFSMFFFGILDMNLTKIIFGILSLTLFISGIILLFSKTPTQNKNKYICDIVDGCKQSEQGVYNSVDECNENCLQNRYVYSNLHNDCIKTKFINKSHKSYDQSEEKVCINENVKGSCSADTFTCENDPNSSTLLTKCKCDKKSYYEYDSSSNDCLQKTSLTYPEKYYKQKQDCLNENQKVICNDNCIPSIDGKITLGNCIDPKSTEYCQSLQNKKFSCSNLPNTFVKCVETTDNTGTDFNTCTNTTSCKETIKYIMKNNTCTPITIYNYDPRIVSTFSDTLYDSVQECEKSLKYSCTNSGCKLDTKGKYSLDDCTSNCKKYWDKSNNCSPIWSDTQKSNYYTSFSSCCTK